MRLIVLQFTLVLFSSNAFSNECDELPTGSGIRSDCDAKSSLETAEKELDVAYKKLLEILSKSDSYKKQADDLVVSQMTWMKYREQFCSVKADINGGSSSWVASSYTYCKSGMAEQQIRELNNILSNFE
ncbi:lysozyme inhibitor LprI family protein [Methylomonas sp. MO1]|uniref:lysozyme inhibitor LprI family protein n=1 Tax=unclassified Methylomonas TaxID=2608980 RepID=UPI0009DF1465|nr:MULTISPECIES: lysozyme inhibitor LprI family protein [unclassified Methylomonas]MDT4288042.1 lysozyme inhibitor LprI family protein [Methylomonas sp. MO1]